MSRLLIAGLCAALLAVAGCARQPVHEEAPHHFSKDARGNRLACYTTDVASEYECVPVARRYGHAYDPLYDPFWPHGYLGWHYGYPSTVYVPYPVNTPPPSNPPPKWHRPRR
jgi:hypothetical protein